MPLSQHLINHLDGGIFHCAGPVSTPGRPCTLTRILCVFVRVGLCIRLCTRVCVCGGGVLRTCVWVGVRVCVCRRGYMHMCIDVRAARTCLWDGVGVHAHVYMCVHNTACVHVFVEHRWSS